MTQEPLYPEGHPKRIEEDSQRTNVDAPCPAKRNKKKNEILDIFYNGLTNASRDFLDSCAGCVFRERTIGQVMTQKYRGSIVVLSISKSVEHNEEQKEMTSGFSVRYSLQALKLSVTDSFVIR